MLTMLNYARVSIYESNTNPVERYPIRESLWNRHNCTITAGSHTPGLITLLNAVFIRRPPLGIKQELDGTAISDKG